MFEKVIIERFRGIRYACIEDFKQINLFFGKNNCGKSSLLESLFLASGLSNPLLPVHINIMRGYNKARYNDLKFEFYNLDSSQPIHIQIVDGEIRDLNISLFEQERSNVSFENDDESSILSNVEEGKYGLKFDFKINNESYVAQLRFESTNPTNATRVVAERFLFFSIPTIMIMAM